MVAHSSNFLNFHTIDFATAEGTARGEARGEVEGDKEIPRIVSGGECVRDRCDREIKRDSCGSRIAEEDDEEKASPPSPNFLFGKQPMEFMDILMFRTFHSFFMSSTVFGKVNYTTSPSDTRKTEVFLAAWRIERP